MGCRYNPCRIHNLSATSHLECPKDLSTRPNNCDATMASVCSLHVGIVGGGIAGLSAAIALKRASHQEEVRSQTYSLQL
jgi:hypothetical protein